MNRVNVERTTGQNGIDPAEEAKRVFNLHDVLTGKRSVNSWIIPESVKAIQERQQKPSDTGGAST